MATDLASVIESRRRQGAGGRVVPSSRTGVPRAFPEAIARESDLHRAASSASCLPSRQAWAIDSGAPVPCHR